MNKNKKLIKAMEPFVEIKIEKNKIEENRESKSLFLLNFSRKYRVHETIAKANISGFNVSLISNITGKQLINVNA